MVPLWMELRKPVMREDFAVFQLNKESRDALKQRCYLPINDSTMSNNRTTYIDPNKDYLYFKLGKRPRHGVGVQYPAPFYLLCGQVLSHNVPTSLQRLVFDVENQSRSPYNIRDAHLKRWTSLKSITVVMHKKTCGASITTSTYNTPDADVMLVEPEHYSDQYARFFWFRNLLKFFEQMLSYQEREHVSVELAVLVSRWSNKAYCFEP
jgi:hypothetical protein